MPNLFQSIADSNKLFYILKSVDNIHIHTFFCYSFASLGLDHFFIKTTTIFLFRNKRIDDEKTDWSIDVRTKEFCKFKFPRSFNSGQLLPTTYLLVILVSKRNQNLIFCQIMDQNTKNFSRFYRKLGQYNLNINLFLLLILWYCWTLKLYFMIKAIIIVTLSLETN